MAAVYIPGWIRCALRAQIAGEDSVNVLNFKTTNAALTLGDLIGLADYLWTELGPLWKAATSTNTLFQDLEVRDQSAAGKFVYAKDLRPETGTVNADQMPGNVSLGVRMRTGRAGRKYHGRVSMYGLTENGTTGNEFSGGTIAAYMAPIARALILPGTGTVPIDLSVASRVGLFLTHVSNILADTHVDSMRTRLAGRGR